MEKELCVKCKENQIANKKRKLCLRCYQKEQYYGLIKKEEKSEKIESSFKHKAEMEFIKNYFKNNDWIYQPAIFRLKDEKYTPDFYDQETNVFIEVVGTRQAYNYNKEKYILLRKLYPKILFEIRNSDGELIEKYMKEVNDK